VILSSRTVEQTIDRHDRATFVKEIVVTKGRVPIAMVRKRLADHGGATRAPVLLVHGFSQNRFAWHLPARSLANHFARAGYDTFNIDLRGHGRSRSLGAPLPRTIDDYVTEDIPDAISEITTHSGGRPVYMVGHSLGGIVGYAAAPRLAGGVAGLVSIGSPYHFAQGSWSLQAVLSVVDAMRRLGVPEFGLPLPMQPVGAVMRTLGWVVDSPYVPLPFRIWHAGALEPHVLEQHLRLAFDRAAITELRSMCEWGAEARFDGSSHDYFERFEAMKNLPLLVVSGQNDDLAPPASVRPAFERSRSTDKTYRATALGHIDLLVGRDAPSASWPFLTSWLAERTTT